MQMQFAYAARQTPKWPARRDGDSSRMRRWVVSGKAWLLPGKRTNSTVLLSCCRGTSCSPLCAFRQGASDSHAAPAHQHQQRGYVPGAGMGERAG